MIRKTVNLSDADAKKLAPYFKEGTFEREALAGAVGEEAPLYSDSAVLSALALLGAKSIQEEADERGYRELAKTYGPEDHRIAEWSLEMAAEAWKEDE